MILLGLEILMLAFVVGMETSSLGYGLLTLFGGSVALGAVTVALPRVAALLGGALALAWGLVGFSFGYLDDGNRPLAFGLAIGGLVLGFWGNRFLFIGLARDGDEAERAKHGFSGRGREEVARPLRVVPEPAGPPKPTKVWDARDVLGVRPRSSRRKIERAFRARMKQYDPDLVAHLGPELRELAERKVREIHAARDALTRFGR